MYVAVIGDIIDSKKIRERRKIQEELNSILSEVNQRFREDIQAEFLITLGDEFQGLLKNPHNVLKIIEFIQMRFYPNRMRFGIGIGEIDTDFIRNEALGADGPAYHKARKMINQLKKAEKVRKRKCEFIKLDWGMDKNSDLLMNTCLTASSFIEQQWTSKQREVIGEIFCGKTISDLVDMIGISNTSIYRRLVSAGFYDYINIRDSITEVLDNKWREQNE